ncbi:MAG: glycosyltransferase family 4 protein [Lachnospiraceae bacterium]|nr:glycosyltransferase family 4 protein [Lachnospiraceae bacterium]
MKKILHLLWSGSIGGIENLCLSIGRRKPQENLFCFVHEGGVIAGQMEKEGLDVELLNLRKWDVLALYKYLSLKIRHMEIDCIIVHHDSGLLWLVSIFLKKKYPGFKVYIYAHCSYKDFIRNKTDRIVFLMTAKWVDGIIAISKYVKKSIVEQHAFLEKTIFVIYNGIDTTRFTLQREKSYKDTSGKIRLIYVGRLIEEKGLQLLLSSIVENALENKVILTIVGDGPYRSQLEKLTLNFHLNNCVSFAGSQEDVLCYLKESDIFVHPAIWEEGFGITIIESMALGVPCIAFNRGAISEIICNEVDGFIVNEVSGKALGSRITELCPMVGTDYWIKICEAAINKSTLFSVDRTIEKIESLIEE